MRLLPTRWLPALIGRLLRRRRATPLHDAWTDDWTDDIGPDDLAG